MPQSIEASEKSLSSIFSDDYLFEIPQYQRPYSWTEDHIGDLLSDLELAMGCDEKISIMAPYFLGSIVIIKNSNGPESEVVDGQQRLTTLTILFCVLRDLSKDSNWASNAARYVQTTGNDAEDISGHNRLNIRKRDREFFERNILKLGSIYQLLGQTNSDFSDSQKRFQNNAKFLHETLKAWDEEKRIRLIKFLVQRCYLVVVSASDKNSAYRIFSVMNDRGMDLSPTDLLKADIIGEMVEGVRENYTNKWEEIEEKLGRDEFRDLFAHIRMIFVKSKARENLNQEFRDGVLTKKQGDEFIDTVLVPMSKAYKIISRAEYVATEKAETINDYLNHLRRIDNYDWMPSAIMFFERHGDQPKILEKFVRDLERLAYGLFLSRADINARIGRYARVLNFIETSQDLFQEISPLQLTDEEKTGIIDAIDGPVYLNSRTRLPLLLRLDGLLAEAGASYDHKTISIEHVLPQSPAESSTWLEWFPKEEDRTLWTNRLANLVLLSRWKNSKAQNYDFGIKKNKYFKVGGASPFALTGDVLGEHSWDIAVLEKRQARLLGKLKIEWRLDSAQN